MYQKLEALCKAQGISIYEACKRAKVADNTVSNVRNNPGRNFSFETLEKFCDALGVSMDYFRGCARKEDT